MFGHVEKIKQNNTNMQKALLYIFTLHATYFPHIPVYDGYMRTFLFGARISALNIEEV